MIHITTGDEAVSIALDPPEGESSINIIDWVAYDMMARTEEGERLALLADMVEIGARVLQRHHDGAAGELVRQELEVMRERMERTIESTMSGAGSGFVQAMEPVMAIISSSLGEITRKLEVSSAVSQAQVELDLERSRGTAKGRTYEAEVAEYIDHVARITGDACEHVGDAGGINGRAGDVLVDIEGARGNSLGKVIFEAKTGRLSKPEAMRELDRAMETRGADYAVLVVAGLEKLPANTFELHEYGGNKIIVAFDELSGNHGLELAYSLARARVLASRVEVVGADLDGARAAVEQALQQLDAIRPIKMRLTSISSAAQDTQGLLDDMASAVRGKLASAATSLSQSA